MKLQAFYPRGGGPKIFMQRLLEYLPKYHDVQIVSNNPDIYLSAVWQGKPPQGAKTIHRVDNIYFNLLGQHVKGWNRKIRRAINGSDAVIYQSEFARKICEIGLSTKNENNTVIYNAIDKKQYESVVPVEQSCDYLFIACADWRPLKRPGSIVRAFLEAALSNSKLVIIGAIDDRHKINHRQVRYTDKLSIDKAISYYKASCALIHIARLDACSNSVVEALAYGKPVICNNAGGTPELVGKDGIIVNVDPPDEYRPFKMKHVDKISIQNLARAIRKSVKQEWNIRRPELDMSHCAKQYYNFFKKTLNN